MSLDKITLDQIIENAKSDIKDITDLHEFNNIKSRYLGKNGLIGEKMKSISSIEDIEEKKKYGANVNKIKLVLQDIFSDKLELIEAEKLNAKLRKDKLDLTLPAREKKIGSIHAITQALFELKEIFAKHDFSVRSGPNIEGDWYNFTALNIEETHPARQMHDSFYLRNNGDDEALGGDAMLRTHTSSVQVRTMLKEKPPYRFIAPGRTYRCDSDMTHSPMFHQIEGLVIDKNIHMGHLKHLIIHVIYEFFERTDIDIRFRPSFFPFTEPSAEVDIKMNGSWLEVLGCGMVHPNVLKNVNVDTDAYQGFAFGFGLERMAMLKYNIKDLRQFFEGDMRFINHYNFSSFDIPSLAGGLSR